MPRARPGHLPLHIAGVPRMLAPGMAGAFANDRGFESMRGNGAMSEQVDQVLAAFVFENGEASRRLLKTIEQIDAVDENVQIVDAAIADRTKLGRVKVAPDQWIAAPRRAAPAAQPSGSSWARSSSGRPARSWVVRRAGCSPACTTASTTSASMTSSCARSPGRWRRSKSALFVLYEGDWSASIGLIEKAVKTEGAFLVQSTLPAETAAALQQLVAPAVEELGGEDVVARLRGRDGRGIGRDGGRAGRGACDPSRSRIGGRPYGHQGRRPQVGGGPGGRRCRQLCPPRWHERA